jgi:hypothetical protein
MNPPYNEYILILKNYNKKQNNHYEILSARLQQIDYSKISSPQN